MVDRGLVIQAAQFLVNQGMQNLCLVLIDKFLFVFGRKLIPMYQTVSQVMMGYLHLLNFYPKFF
jgi:hypothetical protein